MLQLTIKQGHQELSMIWFALIAPSGFAKSPPLNYARKPIDRLQREAREKYEWDKEQYAIDLAEYKKAVADNSNIPKKPTPPVLQRYDGSGEELSGLHDGTHCKYGTGKSCNTASAFSAARCSASFFVTPHADGNTRSPTRTCTLNVLRCSGP